MAFGQVDLKAKFIKQDLDNLTASDNVSNMSHASEVEGLSCGYPWIDWAGGVPDEPEDSGKDWMLFPKGAVVEVAGLPQTSKTTLVLEMIAYNQAIFPEKYGREFRVKWVDAERTLTKQKQLGEVLGVNFSKEYFRYSRPMTCEGGLQDIVDTCKLPKPPLTAEIEASKKKKKKKDDEQSDQRYRPDVIIVDTLAAMRPAVEFEKGIGGNKQPGVKAKLVTEFFRNVTTELEDDGPCIIFLNQLYEVIGEGGGFGDKKLESACSKALGFYAVARYILTAFGFEERLMINPNTYEEQKRRLATISKLYCTKSKFGAPYREARFINWLGIGIEPLMSLVAAALAKGKETKVPVISEKAGGWFSVLAVPGKTDDEDNILLKKQSKDVLVKALRTEPEVLKKLAANVGPVWVEQIERYLKHPKNLTKGKKTSFEPMVAEDTSKMDVAALANALAYDEKGNMKMDLEAARQQAEKQVIEDMSKLDEVL